MYSVASLKDTSRGHGGPVVTHLSSTSKVSSSNPGSYVGKLVVKLFTDGRPFTVQKLDQLHVPVSYAHKTARCIMTYTVLKATFSKSQIYKLKDTS